MQTRGRAVIDAAMRRSPAQFWFRVRAAGRLAVLAYHGVDDRDAFAAQLDYVLRFADPVSTADIVRAATGGRPLPRRSVLVTFDDGHRTVLDNAAPELHRRGIPAVAFVIAGLIDTDTAYWWSDVEAMVADGTTIAGVPDHLGDSPARWVRWLKTVDDDIRRAVVASMHEASGRPARPMRQLSGPDVRALERHGIMIGNHTLTHPCLDRCDVEAVHREITEAHAILTSITGHEPTAFAYPNGNLDARADRLVRALGYELGFLFDHRLSDVPPPDLLQISRLRVSDTTSPDRFATILSGLHSGVHHARGRI